MECGLLVPWRGIEPVPSAWEVQSLNPWTAREIQDQFVFQETNSGDHAEKRLEKEVQKLYINLFDSHLSYCSAWGIQLLLLSNT